MNFIISLEARDLKKDTKGFSLVELIVVIVILGVLVGIAVPNFMGYIEQAKEARDRSNIVAVDRAFSVAVTEKRVTISPGTIYYAPDGTLTGIGETLTEEFATTFGAGGKTDAPGKKGYKMPALTSKKYRDLAAKNSNKGFGFDFKWSDAKNKRGYIIYATTFTLE